MTEGAPSDGPRPAGDRLGRYLDLYLGGCAAFILFCLMLLTFVDVVGREVFNTPVPGGFEITELMMAALIFVGLPIVSWREEHVVIDLFDSVVPSGMARYRQIGVNLVSTIAMGVLAWKTWTYAVELEGYNEITEYLEVPVWPIIYLVAVMSGVATLVLAINVVRYAVGGFDARPADGSV